MLLAGNGVTLLKAIEFIGAEPHMTATAKVLAVLLPVIGLSCAYTLLLNERHSPNAEVAAAGAIFIEVGLWAGYVHLLTST